MRLKADDLSNDKGGYYCHPEFSEFLGEDERYISEDELREWAASKGVEIYFLYDEFPEWTHEGAELADKFWDNWKPEPPDESWTILSRLDDEDGGIHAIFYRDAKID